MPLDPFLEQIFAPLRQQGIEFSNEPNELNKFDRYSYHLKLSLISDFDSADPKLLERIQKRQVSQVVVAESGVTVGFNLTECEISDALSSNFRNRTSVTTEISMTIVEPYALTLPDKLYTGAVELNIKNWRMGSMILELWFRGYNEAGVHVDTLDSKTIYKAYKLQFVEFNSQLTETGSTYRIRAIADGNFGFLNQYYQLPTTFVYDPNQAGRIGTPNPAPGAFVPAQSFRAGTVGDFFQYLGQELTDFYVNGRQAYNPGQVVPFGQNPGLLTTLPIIVYKFEVAPILAVEEINFEPQARGRQLSWTQGAGGGMVTVGRGISLTNLLDDVMASLKDDKFFYKDDDQTGKIRIPRIEARVVNIGWDAVLNDYVREITYFIGIRESFRPIPSPEFGNIYQSNIDKLAEERLRGQAKLVKKIYPYYYTGNNTEILKLDIDFNNLHIIPIPYGNGQNFPPFLLQALNTSLNDLAAARNNFNDAQRDMAQRRSTLQALLGAGPMDAPAIMRAERELIEAEDRLRRAADELGRRRGQGIGALVPGSLPSNVTIDPAVQNALDELRTSRLGQRRFQRFAEDLLIPKPEDVRPGQLTYFTDPRDISNYWTRQQAGGDSAARILYSTILGQIYDRIGSGMTEIEMEIRGDPYWLGQSNLERDEAFEQWSPRSGSLSGALATPPPRVTPNDYFASIQLDDNKYLNATQNDALFVLLFRAGTIPNEKTGYMDLKNNVEWFHALYIALTVTHVFRDGKFTQKIQAIREPINNLQAGRALPVSPQQGSSFPG